MSKEKIAKEYAMGFVFTDLCYTDWAILYDNIITDQAFYEDLEICLWEPFENYDYKGACGLLEDCYESNLSMLDKLLEEKRRNKNEF